MLEFPNLFSIFSTDFFINEEEIEIVTSIKYLGLVLKLNGSLKPAIATLANQAKKAPFTLMQKVVYLDYPPPFLLLKLFDALITPVLEYVCQIWGYMTSNNTGIELMYRKFCKYILTIISSGVAEGGGGGEGGRGGSSTPYQLRTISDRAYSMNIPETW